MEDYIFLKFNAILTILCTFIYQNHLQFDINILIL
jgi:hypothetical protein